MQTESESIEKSLFRRFAVRPSAALDHHPVLFVLVLAFAVMLTVEMAGRHSLWQGIVFLFTHPIHIAANMTIILITLAIGLFFRKRVFFIAFFTTLWLGLGVTNAIVLIFRVTPFGAIDIALLPSVYAVLTVPAPSTNGTPFLPSPFRATASIRGAWSARGQSA